MGKLLLIAGHGKNYNGSYDPGACSIFGQEADYTRELVTMIQQAVNGAVSVDVYDMDKNCYSYSKHGQVPNYAAYEAVLEIHFNAKSNKDENGDGRFTGMGAYVHPNNSGGKDLAKKIINDVVNLGFKEWQICNSKGLHNLNKAQAAGVKYALLETAFIDDGDDMNWYNANKAAVAQAIANVLKEAVGGTKDTFRISTGTKGLKVTASSLIIRDQPNGSRTGKYYREGEYIKPYAKAFVNGKPWYCTDKGWVSAKYLEGWVLESNDKWWYVSEGYAYAKDFWMQIDGLWYYFDSAGWMLASQWLEDGGRWYYLKADGSMATYCYVKSTGREMYYWMNKDGVWEPEWNTATPDLNKYRLVV